MQPNLLRNLCFLPTKNTKYRTFYRTHFLLISITCLSRYISLSFYRPALLGPKVWVQDHIVIILVLVHMLLSPQQDQDQENIDFIKSIRPHFHFLVMWYSGAGGLVFDWNSTLSFLTQTRAHTYTHTHTHTDTQLIINNLRRYKRYILISSSVQFWIIPSLLGSSVLYFLSDDQWETVSAWMYGTGLSGLFIMSTMFHTVSWKKSHLRWAITEQWSIVIIQKTVNIKVIFYFKTERKD